MGKKITKTFECNKLEPQTKGQLRYAKAIERNKITICTGPAGTGKTFISLGIALNLLRTQEWVQQIIISRPFVETGKGIGYLPGDIDEKSEPYMKPVRKVFQKFIGRQDLGRLINTGEIEMLPLEYMRGETFDNAIMILDEAQNADEEQVLMFITRMGKDSKVIISGDLEQSDLHAANGLKTALECLQDQESIDIVKMTKEDQVRNGLISIVTDLFSEHRNKSKINGNGRKHNADHEKPIPSYYTDRISPSFPERH